MLPAPSVPPVLAEESKNATSCKMISHRPAVKLESGKSQVDWPSAAGYCECGSCDSTSVFQLTGYCRTGSKDKILIGLSVIWRWSSPGLEFGIRFTVSSRLKDGDVRHKKGSQSQGFRSRKSRAFPSVCGKQKREININRRVCPVEFRVLRRQRHER